MPRPSIEEEAQRRVAIRRREKEIVEQQDAQDSATVVIDDNCGLAQGERPCCSPDWWIWIFVALVVIPVFVVACLVIQSGQKAEKRDGNVRHIPPAPAMSRESKDAILRSYGLKAAPASADEEVVPLKPSHEGLGFYGHGEAGGRLQWEAQ